MNSSPGTVSSKSLASAALRRLLIAWLPIISVGLLIFYLSGGMPPAVWQLLIQMLSRWNVLQATLGNGIFLPFAIVLAQSLMILVAWILLAFTIWREVSVVNTLRAQQRIVRLQEALLAAQAAPPLALVPENTRRVYQGVQVMPDELDVEFSQEDIPLPLKNTGIKIISGKNSDLFDESEAIFELAADRNEPEGADAPSTGLALKEEETIFVYGNPFEGDLPEVFEYDKDLKHGVQDMQDELSNQKQVNKENKMQQEEKKDE